MTTLYKETIVPGEVVSWHRADRIVLLNTDPPEARIHEVERKTYPDGRVIDVPTAQFDIEMTDPDESIPLVDPVTFEPTGQTFTAGQFAVMATSLYFWKARQRDGISE